MTSAPLVTSPVSIFFIVLAIIVLAPVLLNRLHIPHIVGMIVAGVIVGPYGLNILADDSSFIIFGQVGLLYLMFLAGLEIDMYHLKLNFRKGILFGILTFLLPIALGVVVSRFLLGLDMLTSFLLGAMYAAHTLISYPVAARFGVTRSPAVLIAVVGTIFAVAGSLLVLAAVTDIARSGEVQTLPLALLLAKIIVYVVAVMGAYPWITKKFLIRYSDRVTQYVFVLGLAFLSAWIAEQIGLSAVLGAFLAGLVLNRYVPPTSPLMSRIEFVGNSIFIPYFLISVGMMVNLHVLAHGATLAVACIMLAVALLSKWGAAKLSEVCYGMSRAEGSMMFGLTTAHTAVALAVVTIGYTTLLPDGNRMLNENILNATILVILVTCALAPIITASAAAKIRLQMLESESQQSGTEANSSAKAPINMLIPVSNPVTSPGLMELALLLAGNKKRHAVANTFLLHVRNDNSKRSRSIGASSLELATNVASAVDVSVSPVQRFDINTVTGITNFIKERDISCVLLGMHRKSTVVDTFFGPKIEQMLEQTHQMIIISRCYIPANTLARIVVYVPPKAYLEEGFALWVRTLGNLAEELGCEVIFYCNPETKPMIEKVLKTERFRIRSTFKTISDHDDFVLMSRDVADDDLFVWVASRPNTVSWNKEQGEMQNFISSYLQSINLLVVYPQITSDAMIVRSFATPFK